MPGSSWWDGRRRSAPFAVGGSRPQDPETDGPCSGTLGLHAVPPGQYRVSLLPKGYHTLELPWAEVTVVAGKTATVNIDAGIELVGRSKEDQPPSQWEALDLRTRKPMAHVEERWGFTPMPPGQYRVSLLPKGYHTLELPWAEVTVVAGKTATVTLMPGSSWWDGRKKISPLRSGRLSTSRPGNRWPMLRNAGASRPCRRASTGSACFRRAITRWSFPGLRSRWSRARRPR